MALKQIHQDSVTHEESGNTQDYAHCNAQFHEILYQACRNKPLAAEIARIRSRPRVYSQSVLQNQLCIRRSREDHARILEALLAGDASAAAEAMQQHIAGGLQDLADMISRVPAQLLAVDKDHPGRNSRESQRDTALRAISTPQERAKVRRAKAGTGR